MNRAGARASCRVAALVCTPPIMWNVWVPECPDSPIAASLQPEPKLNPSRIAGPEDLNHVLLLFPERKDA